MIELPGINPHVLLKSLLDAGLAFVYLGQCEKAEGYYRRALQTGPQDDLTVFAFANLGHFEADPKAGCKCRIAERLKSNTGNKGE